MIVDVDKIMALKEVNTLKKGDVDSKITKLTIKKVEIIYHLEVELEDSKIIQDMITEVSGKKVAILEEEGAIMRKDNGGEVIQMIGVIEVAIQEDREEKIILEKTKAEVKERKLRGMNNYGINLQVKMKVKKMLRAPQIMISSHLKKKEIRNGMKICPH